MSNPLLESLLPRLIRLKDAPGYLGMDRKLFNRWVRPSITQIPVGARGVGFDRLDLDDWFSNHKHRNGIPATRNTVRRKPLWQKRERQGSTKDRVSGTLINKSSERGFAKVLERLL